jgi:hypothetical protein
MNIQNAVAIRLDEVTGEQTHVAGKTNNFDVVIFERRDYRAVVFLTRSTVALDGDCFQSPIPGAIESRGIGMITNNHCDFRIWNATFIYGVSEREHV